MKEIIINDNSKNLKKISSKRKIKKKSKEVWFSDIETVLENGVHKVVCLAIISNQSDNAKTFLTIDSYIKFVKENCSDSIIYFHNFGRFDSTFILKWFIQEEKEEDIEVIERNNIIYQVLVKNRSIYFRDSLLILNMSLKNIGETFCKINKKNDFEYNDITNLFAKDPNKVLEQCIQDCRVLKEGFNSFSQIILEKFEINVQDCLTLPSLALNIFKLHYYDDKILPITKNPYDIDSFIRRSYKGGVSELYKPYLKNGYCYDANSLYPSVMHSNEFPLGKGRFYKKNEIKLTKFIGFIECKIKTDKDLKFLTYKHPTKGLISPIGEWIDVYYHKEVIFAIELGYEVEIIKGFGYDNEGYIFKKYVEDMYNLRKSSQKEMKNIAKLLLNSLYGRFGMKVFIENTKFIKEQDIEKIKHNYDIKNIEYLGNKMYTIRCVKRNNNRKDLYKNSIDTETAVQIASAITAEARIFMYPFKNLNSNTCYYTDTDSVFLEKPLNSEFIGENLGEFKLEYKINKAYFIAPKVYYVYKEDLTEKFVIKGLKSSELKKEVIKKTFIRIINSKDGFLKVERENIFKRNLVKLITYIEKFTIKFNFPLNKRVKVYQDNKWISTRPLKIKN